MNRKLSFEYFYNLAQEIVFYNNINPPIMKKQTGKLLEDTRFSYDCPKCNSEIENCGKFTNNEFNKLGEYGVCSYYICSKCDYEYAGFSRRVSSYSGPVY